MRKCTLPAFKLAIFNTNLNSPIPSGAPLRIKAADGVGAMASYAGIQVKSDSANGPNLPVSVTIFTGSSYSGTFMNDLEIAKIAARQAEGNGSGGFGPGVVIDPSVDALLNNYMKLH